MRKWPAVLSGAAAAVLSVALVSGRSAPGPTSSAVFEQTGTPHIQSAGPIAFAPDGTLFVGDSRGAAVFAVATDRPRSAAEPPSQQLDQLERRLAALIGAAPSDVRVVDMAIHPLSREIYLSVMRAGAGSGLSLVRIDRAGQLEPVDLTRVRYSKTTLSKPPAPGVTVRGWPNEARIFTVTDMAFMDGRLYVSGLSNEEFASTMRVVPFPFTGGATATGLEVYHVSHGKYETHAPINVFTPFRVNGKPSLLATYACLPLASFPLDDLKDGARVRGTTVAELGAGQSALDMLTYQFDGKPYLLVAAGGGLYRFDASQFERAPSLTTPLSGAEQTSGAPFRTLDKAGARLLGELDANRIVIIRRDGPQGPYRLQTVNKSDL